MAKTPPDHQHRCDLIPDVYHAIGLVSSIIYMQALVDLVRRQSRRRSGGRLTCVTEASERRGAGTRPTPLPPPIIGSSARIAWGTGWSLQPHLLPTTTPWAGASPAPTRGCRTFSSPR